MLCELVREDLANRRGRAANGAAMELAVQFVVGALWATIVWWHESGVRLPAAEVNALFQRLAFPGLDMTLGEKL